MRISEHTLWWVVVVFWTPLLILAAVCITEEVKFRRAMKRRIADRIEEIVRRDRPKYQEPGGPLGTTPPTLQPETAALDTKRRSPAQLKR